MWPKQAYMDLLFYTAATAYFIFDKFYNQFLIRKRWDVQYSRTAQMLKETCNCDDKRISKERISVFVVKQFDKKQKIIHKKNLNRKTHINENNCIRTTRNWKNNHSIK